MADDRAIQDHIEELVAEEHRLLESHGAERLTAEEHDRLKAVQVQLDQTWDLLRQRRARREAGLDPEGAAERPADVVENYEG